MVLAVALVAVAACNGEPTRPVPRWTLSVAGQSRGEVRLPARLGGRVPDGAGRYALSTTVDLPAAWRGQPLSLSIPQLYAVAHLRVDGALISPAEPDLERGYRSVGQHIFTIPAALTRRGELSLRLELAQQLRMGTWFDSVPRLSLDPDGDLHTRAARAFNTWSAGAALGALSTIMFTCLVMFALDRRRAEFGWWALRTASASMYCWFVLGSAQTLFGRSEIFVLALSLVLAAITAVYATNAQFSLGSVSRWFPALFAVSAAFIVCYWGRYDGGDVLGPVTIVVVGALLVYDTPRLLRLVRRKPRPVGALPNLIGWVLLAILVAPDFVQWTGIVDPLQGFRPGAMGLALFALLQFVALSGSHVVSLRRADELNVELQHQIAERSRQLSDALARLATRSVPGIALAAGEIVNDRYEVVRELGAGAMGTVYEVRRRSDGRLLALKALRGTSDAGALARFAREAQLAGSVDSEHVVRIFDVDFASAGFMYLVMERIDGRTLKQCADRFGDTDWAVEVLAQVAAGLATIHEHGIVHRDLKPANVLLAREDGGTLVKIADFGIAGLLVPTADPAPDPADADATQTLATAPLSPAKRAASAEAAGETLPTRVSSGPAVPPGGPAPSPAASDSGQLTQTGALLGTPIYMAPELGRGAHTASSSSDVFSLGVMAFELLAGERPFATPPCFEIAAGMTPTAARELAPLCPKLSPALAEVIQRSLSADQADRPTAAELERAFAAARRRPR